MVISRFLHSLQLVELKTMDIDSKYTEIKLLALVAVFLGACVLAVAAEQLSSEPCKFLSVFRSGKLPGSPQSNLVGAFFLFVLFSLIYGIARHDVRRWRLSGKLILLPDTLFEQEHIWGLLFGGVKAKVRAYLVYPIISFGTVYLLLKVPFC